MPENFKKRSNISNEVLYGRTPTKPWSTKIKARLLRFLGHILRLNRDTPATETLNEYHIAVEQDPGKPPINWWNTISQRSEEHRRRRFLSLKFDTWLKIEKAGKPWWGASCTFRTNNTLKKEERSRLLHSPRLVVVGLSMWCQTWPPIGCCCRLCDWVIWT